MSRSARTSKKSARSRTRNFSKRYPVLEPLEARMLLSAAATFTNVGVGGGGGMYKPRISPFNPQDVYIESDQGELFYSSNFGQSWTTVNFQEAIGGQDNPIQFTNDSRILYSIQNSGAVSKSTDSGLTWNVVSGWNTGSGGQGFALQVQSDLTNSNILFAVTSSGIYESTNGGTNFTALTGLTYVTGSDAYIAGEFNNGTNIYLGTTAGLLIFNETSSTWTAGPSGIPNGYAMVSMSGATSGGTTRLTTVVTSSSAYPGMDDYVSFTYSSDLAPFTLDVGGSNTWVQKNTTFFGSSTLQYAAYIQMVSGDINTIIASGTDSSFAVQIFKSTDGGTTWTAMMQLPAGNIQTGSSSDLGASFGGGAQGLAVDPANANYIMVSNNVGTWASSNGGTSWLEVSDSPGTLAQAGAPESHGAYSSTLNPTSIWGLTFINQQTIFANFTDITGVYSTNGGSTWTYPTFGGAYANTIYNTSYDPRTGLLYGAFSGRHDMFMETRWEEDENISGANGFIAVSSDMGATWTQIHSFPVTGSTFDPVVNILVDPNVANKAYALVDGQSGDVGGVYYTTDLQDGATSRWAKLPDPPRTENHPWDIQELTNGNLLVTYGPTFNITTMQEDASSGVFLWNASAMTWTDLLQNYNGTVNANNPLGADLQFDVRDVTIDPQDATQQTYYISLYDEEGAQGLHGVVGQHPNSGVWKTTNGGTTWTQIFAADGAMSVAINPATHEMYVASTASGVWYSSNANAAIPTFNQMAGEPFSTPTRIYIDPFNPGQIWVTTFGDGILVSNTTAPVLPSVPAGLTAQSLSSTQVKLTWTDPDVPTPQGYIIDQSSDGLNWTTVDTINSATNLSAIIGGLTANTAYYFRVKGFNSFGTSVPDDMVNALGNVITVTTDSGTGILAYDGFTDTTIGGPLSGTNGTGGTGWATNWSGPSSGSTTISSGSLIESVTNLGGTLNTSGNSVAEMQQGIGDTRTTTPTIGAAGTVFWVSALFTVTGTSNVPISLNIGGLSFGLGSSNNWYLAANGHFEGTPTATATNGKTYLVVVRVDNETSTPSYAMWIDPVIGATAPDYSGSIIGNVTDTNTPFSPTNTVSIGESAYYTASNVDEIRIGTTFASVTPHSAPAVPSTPIGLADTVASTTEMDLTWTALASDQKGFHIQMSTNGTTYTTIDTVNNASATSYQATNLVAGTQYWFRITGFNDTGDSSVSSVVTNTTLIPAPAQPTNLVAAINPSSSNFNLTWTDNATNETGYNVYYTTNVRNSYGQAIWTLAATLAANSTSYAVTGLTANTLYYFKVSAINSTAEVFSPISSGLLPAAPTGLTATASSYDQISLSWNNNSPPSLGYHLQYSTDNATWTTITINNPTTTIYSTNIFSTDTEYYFRVSAFSSNGDSAYSSVAVSRTLTNNGLIAYDDFSYSAGTTLNGDNAGTGWATAWSTSPTTGANIATGSLTGPTGLITSGNKLNITQQDIVSRTTSTTFGQTGTTTWISFLVTIPSDDDPVYLNLGTSAHPIEIGNLWSSNFGISNANDLYLNGGSSMPAVAGQTYFVVASILNGSSSETYDIWLNPAPGNNLSSPTGSPATITTTADDFQATNALTFTTSTYFNTGSIDEVRLGTSYAAVAPMPAPAAPTGLSAVAASSSQINLSWTNSTGTSLSGVNVQRSTDGVNFTTIATLGATVTTYSDTSLSSSTTYYYRVTDYTSFGDSLYAAANATTQSGSTLIAYEGFNYTPTTSPNGLNGSNGGTGWNSAWSSAGGNGAYSTPVVSGSLSAASPANTLSTSGNSVTQTSNAVSTRTTTQAFGGANSTTWVSYLVKTSSYDEASFDIGNAVIGIVNSSDDWGIIANSGASYLVGSAVAAANTTYFIVAEIIKPTSGNETYLLWVNPTPGSTAPSTASAALNNTTINGNFNSSNTIKLGFEGYTSTVGWDEIRLGTTYAAVAPTTPGALTNLTVNSTHSASYVVHNRALSTGISQYGDQTTNFTTVPSQYLGATYITTAESDVTSTSSNLMTLTFSQPVELYVAFDDAITTKPTWLTSQFTDTGDNIITTQGTFSVYKVLMPAGSITLGGAGGLSTQGMYSVFFM